MSCSLFYPPSQMIENENAKFMKVEQVNSKECSFVVWKNKVLSQSSWNNKVYDADREAELLFIYKIIYSDECTLPLIILLGQLKGQDINKVNHLPHL